MLVRLCCEFRVDCWLLRFGLRMVFGMFVLVFCWDVRVLLALVVGLLICCRLGMSVCVEC